MKTFAQAIRAEDCIYDLRATIHKERRYFIVRVAAAKRAAFLRAVEKDAGFRLEDFAEILHRGWDEPDEALKAQLKAQYGLYE
jgi:hypothetical protein